MTNLFKILIKESEDSAEFRWKRSSKIPTKIDSKVESECLNELKDCSKMIKK